MISVRKHLPLPGMPIHLNMLFILVALSNTFIHSTMFQGKKQFPTFQTVQILFEPVNDVFEY